jgi:hypothetical protein
MKIYWTNCVKNEGVKEESNMLHITNQKEAHWTGHILHRNSLLKHISEGKMERMRR